MKKKLIRIWGIGLTLVLAASLLLSAAPVSAGTLSWGSEDLPDEFVDTAGDNIVDLAVSGDGSVIYASVGSTTIYRSTNGGESWSSITVVDTGTPNVYLQADFLAVTPDDPNYLAVASDNATVFISDDAGANWDTLGQINGGATIDDVWDLAISVEKGGNHFVAVVGDDGGADAEIWYYEIGAVGAQWKDAEADMGGADSAKNDIIAAAVAFSPNFYSDQAMVALTFDATNDETNFSMYSFNTNTWNSGAFIDFPKNLQQGSEDLASIQAAAIAMAPDYLGSDDDMRIAFVGLAVNGATDEESEGIFRLENTDVEVLKDEEAICSIAFDGSLLVAGHYSEVTIYRSTDALDDSPSVSSSTGSKEPGGDDKVIVGIAGSTVVAGTSGDESAFAYSEDNGKTFNDLSLIDTTLAVLCDVEVSPDGEMVYLVTADSDATPDMSIWRLSDRWERIYNDPDTDDDYIIRMAPDDPDVIYLANSGETEIYFSSDAGDEKWHTRVYKEGTGVVDLAVETDGDTVYVLTTSGYVSKSTNRGFVWDAKKSCKLSGGSNMIASLGEDLLIAGSTDGYVSYSTDGNVSWSKLDDDIGGEVQVTATGLADGDMVIASANDTKAYFYQWELGEDDEWDAISSEGDIPSGYNVTGIGLFEGVLYATTSNNTDSKLFRTLTPTSDDPTWSTVASAGEAFDAAPKALKISASGDVTKLWAIDVLGQALFSYKDSLAITPVTTVSPADAALVPFNRVSGESEQIIFTWKSPSDKVTKFNFEIATDSGFDEDVLSLSVEKSSGSWDEGDIISQIVGPGSSTAAAAIRFMEDTTYYWRVRVDAAGPVRSNYSEVRSFTTGALPEVQPPVVIEQPPAPVISIPPAPAITLQPPEIVLPPPQAVPEIVIPAAPAPTPAVPTWAIYAIIIIGAVLVIALVVLIMRTRRPV